jgi:hypothetical protein
MKESKKLLIGFGVVAVLCMCAAGISYFAFREFGKRMTNAIGTDTASVDQAKENIAEFDVPEGYSPTVMSFLTYDMVTLNSESSSGSRMMIMMMQTNSFFSGNSEQTTEQLRQAMRQQGSQPGMSMKLIETHEEVIRGETVIISVSEGNYQSFTMRQWMTVFTGNKGPTILMIQGPAESWDDQIIEDFLKSIK